MQLQSLLFRLSEPDCLIKPRSFKQAVTLFSSLLSQELPRDIVAQLYCWKGALYALKNRNQLNNEQEAKKHLQIHHADYLQIEFLLEKAHQALTLPLPKNFDNLLKELTASYIDNIHQVNYSKLPEDMNTMLVSQTKIRLDRAEHAVLSALPDELKYLFKEITAGCLKTTQEAFISSGSPETFAADSIVPDFIAEVARVCLEEIQELQQALPDDFVSLQTHVLLDSLKRIKNFQGKMEASRKIPIEPSRRTYSEARRSSIQDDRLSRYSSITLIKTSASFRLREHAYTPLQDLWTTAQTLLRNSLGLVKTVDGRLRKESPRLAPTP
jgi:hypothetical protein